MSVVTGLAIAGFAISATATGLSFAQSANERNKMNEANDSAAEAMVEARKKLDVNYMDELAINKEAYEMEQDTILAQAQAATQLGVEGDARGASATAGRVQLATAAGAQATRVAMGSELQQLDKLSAMEDSRLRDIGVQLDLEEVKGAQEAARDAEQLAIAAEQAGIQGVGDTLQQGVSLGVGLYDKNTKEQRLAMGQFAQNYEGDAFYNGDVGRGKNKVSHDVAQLQNVDWENMTNKQFKDWSKGLSPARQQSIFGSEAWANIYQKPEQDPWAWQYEGGTKGLNKAQLAYLESLK